MVADNNEKELKVFIRHGIETRVVEVRKSIEILEGMLARRKNSLIALQLCLSCEHDFSDFVGKLRPDECIKCGYCYLY